MSYLDLQKQITDLRVDLRNLMEAHTFMRQSMTHYELALAQVLGRISALEGKI